MAFQSTAWHANAQSDSTRTTSQTLDSLSTQVTNAPSLITAEPQRAANEMLQPVDSTRSALTEVKSKIQLKIDSLKAKGLSSEKEQRVLDSINTMANKPNEYIQQAQDFEQKLKTDIQQGIPGYDTLSQIKQKGSQVMGDVNAVTNDLGIGNLGGDLKPDLPGGPDQSLIPGMPGLNTSVSGLDKPDINTNLPGLDGKGELPGTNLPGEIGEVKQKVGDLGNVMNEGGEILQKGQSQLSEVKSIQEDGLRSEKLDGAIEGQLQNVEGISELQNTEGGLNVLTAGMPPMKSEEDIRKALIERSKDLATDLLFAKQQPMIEANLKKLRMHRGKFRKPKDVDTLKRDRPNPMKELHWRERLVPGLFTQSLNLDKFYFQIDPHIYYRISGVFAAGVGGMYRFSMNASRLTFDDFGCLVGTKVFVQARVYKGFYIHTEAQQFDWKPVFIPPTNDPQQWERGTVAAAGIGKDYLIGKRIKGNMQLLYHQYWGENDPYKSKLMVRFGIDFSIKKREKKPWEEKLKALKKKEKQANSAVDSGL